jgi:hypothetical protein
MMEGGGAGRLSTAPIDAQELPFSEDEFYRAFRLGMSDEEAREAAEHIALLVHDTARKNALAEQARRRGSTEPAELGLTTWVVDNLLFAFLTLVSDDLLERVSRYMCERWESERPGRIQSELIRAKMSVLAQPTPEVLTRVDGIFAEYEAEWLSDCEEAREIAAKWTTEKGSRSVV